MEELVVFSLPEFDGFYKDGVRKPLPKGWVFVPSGDALLTRRLKAAAPEYWLVKRPFAKHKISNVGVCVPETVLLDVRQKLEAERTSPEYTKRLAASRRRSAAQQEDYKAEFQKAVIAFLDFDERWRELAKTFAKIVTDFTTPVGSGTVARTQMIPIEDRARAAVIAWMRHNTTDYDHKYIPRRKGARREVRHELALESLALLEIYRDGDDAPKHCPLMTAITKAVEAQKENQAPKPAPTPKLDDGDFWL